MAPDLGTRIAQLRLGRNLSQEALANELGVSRQAVSRWECGETLPDTENLIALADLFEVTLDELIRPKTEAADAEAEIEEGSAETEIAEAMTSVEPVPEAGPGPEPEPEPTPEAAPTPQPAAGQPASIRRRAGIALIIVGMALVLLSLFSRLVIGGFPWSLFDPYVFRQRSSREGITEDAPKRHQIDIDAEGITSIDFSWPSGNVQVMPIDDAETDGNIRLIELRFSSGSDDALVWSIEDDELKVYADPDIEYIGETSVTLMVPASLLGNLDGLSVEVLAGNMDIQNMELDELDLTIGSGFASIEAVVARTLDLEVASGEAHVRGRFEEAGIDVMSGLAEVAMMDASGLSKLSLEVASGNLVVVLPENAGFTLVEEASGPGQVRASDFPIVYNGRAGIVGDGRISIEAEIASGTIEIQPTDLDPADRT